VDSIITHLWQNRGPFPCWKWLLYGWAVALVVSVFANPIIPEFGYRQYILPGLVAVWSIIWLALRCILPRAKHGKIGIVLSIETDGSSDEAQVRGDLVRQLRETIGESGLASRMQVLDLNPAQSRVANAVLLSEGERTLAQHEDPKKPDATWHSGWRWLAAGTRGRLFIWGSVRRRPDTSEGKYWLQLNATATHSSVTPEMWKTLQKEFGSVWLSKFCIGPQRELPAIEAMGNLVALASLYLVGLAAFVSADPETAFAIHSKVFPKLPDGELKMPQPVKTLREHARSYAVDEAYMLALRAYRRQDAQEALAYLNKALTVKQDYVPALLLRAIVEWSLLADTEAAVQSIQLAKQFSSAKDNAWRYSNAFLLLDQGKYTEAVKEYKKIAAATLYSGEEQVIAEVVDFLEEQTRRQPSVSTHEFALAFVLYKRQYNLPNALFHFDEFLRKSAGDKSTGALRERALSYNSEISHELKLRKRRDKQTQ